MCIECGGVSLLLDIFRFPSFSHVHETRLYHWTFSAGHFNHWVIFLNHIHKSEEHVLLGQPFIYSTYKSWFENVSSLVVSPRTCLSPRTKPKAQYAILGPYPYRKESRHFINLYTYDTCLYGILYLLLLLLLLLLSHLVSIV